MCVYYTRHYNLRSLTIWVEGEQLLCFLWSRNYLVSQLSLLCLHWGWVTALVAVVRSLGYFLRNVWGRRRSRSWVRWGARWRTWPMWRGRASSSGRCWRTRRPRAPTARPAPWRSASPAELFNFDIDTSSKPPSLAKVSFKDLSWNNGKEVRIWGVAEIQKMSPSSTGRCYCCHYLSSYWSHEISADQSPSRNCIRRPGVVGKTILDVQTWSKE